LAALNALPNRSLAARSLTGRALTLRVGRPIAGQHEVCGSARRTKDAEWIASEGVYFPSREQSEL
jgi:hypothetical protein